MKRTLSILALLVACLGWVVFTACNQQVIETPIRSFDRPSDVALACVQFDSATGQYRAHPLAECDPTGPKATTFSDMGLVTSPVLGPNPNTPFLLALVAQSARGEVAFVDTFQNKLIDADPRKPGFGFVPVGSLPEHVRATSDSCYGFTANVDSCDFARVEVESVLAGSLPRTLDGGSGDMSDSNADLTSHVTRYTVQNLNGGVLYARPSWMEIAPNNPNAQPDSKAQPDPSQPQPNDCSTSTSQRAWVAFPACQLVAELQFATDGSGKGVAKIVGGVRVTKSGATVLSGADLAAVSCPVECTGTDGGTNVVPSGSSPSDMGGTGGAGGTGGTPTTQAAPGTLAFDPSGTRLIIGDNWGKRLDIIPITNAPVAVDAPTPLGTPTSVTLDGDPLGVNVVRVSPRGEAGQFVYAIARDNTVRVVDLDRQVECETNPDPRWNKNGLDLQQTPTNDPTFFLNQPITYARRVGCFPVGDPNTPRRSGLASTPGITLPPGTIPSDVAFVHLDRPNTTTTANQSGPLAAGPGVLVGDFVWVFTSNGQGLVVQLFDDCPQPNMWDNTRQAGPFTDPSGQQYPSCDPRMVAWSIPQAAKQSGHPQAILYDRIAHRLRSGHPRFQMPQSPSDPVGQPRMIDEQIGDVFSVAVPPTSATVDGGTADGGPGDPSLASEPVDPSLIDPNAIGADTVPDRFIAFSDPDATKTEIWSAAWEGTLPGTDRPLGALSVGDTSTIPSVKGPVGVLSDNGGAWCGRGVLAGDKLVIKGCVVDTDCDQAGFHLPAGPGVGAGDVFHYQCIHDPGAPSDVTNGLCLYIGGQKFTPDFWSAQCGSLLRSQRKYRITSAQQFSSTTKPDRLELTEIYEPEFQEQTHSCTTSDDCIDVLLSQSNGTVRSASCLPDWDGQNRCLFACDTDPNAPNPRTCGIDYECANSKITGDARCMRAPIDAGLWGLCFPELQDYEIHAGGEFLVGGTTTGYLLDVNPDVNGECVPDRAKTEWARLHQSRVPLTPPNACPPNMTKVLDSMDPDDPSVTGDFRNVCRFPSTAATNAMVAHFENPFFQVAISTPLTNIGTQMQPLVPPDGLVVSWSVLGGGNYLTAVLGVDIQAQLPRYATVAPDRQTVYVIDEGKFPTATGLRGQLFRLFTPTQTVDTTFVIR